MKTLKVIFLGTPDFVQPIKDSLAKHFTLVDALDKADLAVVAAFGKILTKKELSIPKFGCVNIHPSLLPKYRGPSPIQSAILDGERTSGLSIIKMDEDIDHGPIIYQEQLELASYDNFDTLSTKMFLRASEILPQVIIDFISGKITITPQDHLKATYCIKLTRDSGYFEINNLPTGRQASQFYKKLDRMIRAFYPWPGVWTRFRQGSSGQARWKIVKFLPSGLMQMEGKKVMPIKDFLNGYPDFPVKSITVDKK